MAKHHIASPLPTGSLPYVPPSAYARERRSEQIAPAGHVGREVRRLRLSANLAAGTLARSAGISRSMLSRIESGLATPSIETLRKLASGLGVPIPRLFSERTTGRSWCYVPRGKRLRIDLGGDRDHRQELLGHLVSSPSSVRPYFVTLDPGARPFVELQHAGIKFIYVVSGRLHYRYGAETIDLQTGDSLLFEAGVEHGAEVAGDAPTSFLSVGFQLSV